MGAFDLLIKNGDLIDGTDKSRAGADIGITNEKITAIGNIDVSAARQVYDATGLVVAPGFIDVHTHDDRLILEESGLSHPKLSQGVTTVITGNCGISLAPLVTAEPPPGPLDLLGVDSWIFDSFSAYLDAIQSFGSAMNVGCLIGHATLRVKHMIDLNREASPAEIFAMAEDVKHALNAGALGMSVGLYYPPAQAASAAEVIAVGDALTHLGGLITMHLRDEAEGIDEAMREAFEIGRALKIDAVLSHHKLVGPKNHGRASETLAQIDKAAKEQSVCMDCYPYNAASTMLIASRTRHSREVIVTWSRTEPAAAGRSLFEMTKQRGCTVESLIEQLSPAGAVYFAMDEEDVKKILAHPLTMVASDGSAHDPIPHLRLWGTFPRVLGHYVRDEGLFSLETAVHKMTGLSAKRFGLKNRGLIEKGNWADITIFDPATISDRATFESPTQQSTGIKSVFVNGIEAFANGRVSNAHAGQLIRRTDRGSSFRRNFRSDQKLFIAHKLPPYLS